MTDYAQVLTVNHPDASWELDGDDYSGLTWHGPGDKPSQAELDAAWPEVKAAAARARVERQRADAYRRDADPLFFQVQRGETTEQDWLDAVAQVKADYPYPDE